MQEPFEKSADFQEPRSAEELEKDLKNAYRWLEQKEKALEEVDGIIDSIEPVMTEIERDPTKKELALLAALRAVKLQATLETKKSWPTTEEYKDDKKDLTMNEVAEKLRQEKEELKRLLDEIGTKEA